MNWKAIVAGWAARLGWLGAGAVLAGAVLVAGEVRENFRVACGNPAAGWLTRHACDWLDVVPPAGPGPVMLGDSDAAQRGGGHEAPPGQTGAGLRVIDLKAKDAAELERILGRDLDGDGTVGKVTPRRPGETFRAGELLFADQNVPAAPRGGRLVSTAKESPASGGEGSKPKGGTPLRNDFIPNPAPGSEWLHQVRYRLSGSLPVNEHKLGDDLSVSIEWTPARTGPLYWGVEPYWRRLAEEESAATGRASDWGARVNLDLRCRGFFHCRPE